MSIIAFSFIVFIAAYVQTITGFAFGLVFMGLIGLTGLINVEDGAAIVSVSTIINAVVVLIRGRKNVNVRILVLTLLGALPAVIVGYALLEWLAGSSLLMLEIILGLVIIVSSFQLLFQPEPLKTLSGPLSFVIFGSFGGILSGLFSSAGPPVVYHFYRQPLAQPIIRETLLALFTCTASIRLMTVFASNAWHIEIFWWSVLASPLVIVATILAHRYPPRLSTLAIRKVVFILLFLSGAALAIPAGWAFLAI